jgi:hypothetical protein
MLVVNELPVRVTCLACCRAVHGQVYLYLDAIGQGKLCLENANSFWPVDFPQSPEGTLQQSPEAAGSLLPASRTTFQLPSGCLRQMVM